MAMLIAMIHDVLGKCWETLSVVPWLQRRWRSWVASETRAKPHTNLSDKKWVQTEFPKIHGWKLSFWIILGYPQFFGLYYVTIFSLSAARSAYCYIIRKISKATPWHSHFLWSKILKSSFRFIHWVNLGILCEIPSVPLKRLLTNSDQPLYLGFCVSAFGAPTKRKLHLRTHGGTSGLEMDSLF